MATYGYHFYFVYTGLLMPFPVTPGELTITVGSNNKVVTLINEGDVNILKSPALTEISFDARFPMRKYPYSKQVEPFQNYFNQYKHIKEKKKSVRFMVVRSDPSGKVTWDTNILVSIESMEIKESADQGDDVIISFKLKQFKEYGIQRITTAQKSPNTTSTSNNNREQSNAPSNLNSDSYVIRSGDTLWGISKKYYGNGSYYTTIYNANSAVLEKAAKEHGYSSSSRGSRIFPGTKITIPPMR